jgi:hypothetical protein
MTMLSRDRHTTKMTAPRRAGVRRVVSIVMLVLSTASSMPAFAQPTSGAIAGAQSLVGEGRKLREAGDMKGARDRFQSAYLLVPTPIIGLDLGKARESLGELIEARIVLVEAAALPPIPKESAESTAARAEAVRIAKDLDARIPTVAIAIEGIEGEGKVVVTLDGIELPEGELAPRPVNPGKHVVVVRHGAHQQRTEVEVAEKDAKTATVVFPKIEKIVEPPKPPIVTPKPRLEDDGEPTTRISPLTYIGFSIAGAGLALGTVTGILSLKKAHDFAAACEGYDFQCPPSLRDDYDSSRRYGNVSTVSFLVGGAGLALGIYGLLHREKVAPSPPPNIALSLGAGSVGIRGAF